MSKGLHNVDCEIAPVLRNVQAARIAPDSGGVGEPRAEGATPVVPPVYQDSPRDWGGVADFYIYLAATPNNRIVKIGVSKNPARRLLDLRIARRVFYRHAWSDPRGLDVLPLRIAQTWPLGVVTRRRATSQEQAIHSAIRSMTGRQNASEWYRLATSKAVAVIDRYLANGSTDDARHA